MSVRSAPPAPPASSAPPAAPAPDARSRGHRLRRLDALPLFALPALLAPLALVPAACGDAGTSEHEVGVVTDTVDGVERVTYGAERAARLGWSLDTTTVIGGFGVDDPNYQFGGVNPDGLATDLQGNLYVLDADGIRVLGYAPDGSFLGAWGREGGGPGELGGSFGGGPRTMAMGPGDTLWIGDQGNQRFTLLPVNRGDPSSVPLPGTSVSIGGKMAVDAAGALALLSSFNFRPGEAAGMPPRPLVRFSREGEPGDTVWTFPAPATDIVTISSGGNQLMMMMSQVFAPGFSWVRFADGGLALQDSPEYEIRFTDPAGHIRRILRREPAARPTGDADRQAVLDSLLTPPKEETRFDTEEIRRQRAEATTFADLIPRIIEMRRDTRNRLWVGVSESTPRTIERIDVYDRDGALLGELRDMPMPDFFFGDGHAALVDSDELDVQRISVVRLVDEPARLETAAD